MKKLTYLLAAILFVQCGTESTTIEGSEPTDSATAETVHAPAEPIEEVFSFIAEESIIKWDRDLDQKPTKQKVKMLGVEMEVELGAVQMQTNGEINLDGGQYVTSDKEPSHVSIRFDFSPVRVAAEAGNGPIEQGDALHSVLQLNDFRNVGDSDFDVSASLLMGDSTQYYEIQVHMDTSPAGATFTGDLVFETLDFPIREKVTKDEVNKDEITAHFTFVFSN